MDFQRPNQPIAQPSLDPITPSRIKDFPDKVDAHNEAQPAQPEAALETMRQHIEELNLPAVAIEALKQDDLIAFRVSVSDVNNLCSHNFAFVNATFMPFDQMMKLTANYVPDLSAYIIGLVQSIEAANVIIFVMAGLEETREPSGKFSLDDETTADNNDDSIDQQLLYIQRNEILHAKYVKV